MLATIGKIWLFNGLSLLGVVLGLVIFDRSLDLGRLHGVVFSLYLAYATGLFALANLVLALISWQRRQKERCYGFLTGSGLVALIGFTTAYFAGRLF